MTYLPNQQTYLLNVTKLQSLWLPPLSDLVPSHYPDCRNLLPFNPYHCLSLLLETKYSPSMSSFLLCLKLLSPHRWSGSTLTLLLPASWNMNDLGWAITRNKITGNTAGICLILLKIANYSNISPCSSLYCHQHLMSFFFLVILVCGLSHFDFNFSFLLTKNDESFLSSFSISFCNSFQLFIQV